MEAALWMPNTFIPDELDFLARVFLFPNAFLSETPTATFLPLLRRIT